MRWLIYFTVLNIYCTENTERLCKLAIVNIPLRSKFSIFDEKSLRETLELNDFLNKIFT
jgi:hypothetical protein